MAESVLGSGMKKSLCIFALTTAVILIFANNAAYGRHEAPDSNSQTSYTPTVDSLLNLIGKSSGPELLKQYPRLHKALYEVNDLDVHLRYNNEFAEAARAAKDRKMEAISAVLRVEALYNYMAADSVLLAESLKALDVIRGVAGAEVHYFYTASVLGDVYMLQGKYEDALEAAERFYAEAKEMDNNSGMVASLQTMGKAYEELGLPDKAEAAFRESIEFADEKVDHGMKGEAYSYLVDMLNGQGRYEEALEVSRKFEAYLKRIDACHGELKNLCFLNLLGCAASYTKLGRYDLSWEYIERAEGFPIAATEIGVYSVENERFPLLLAEGRYAEAERSIDRIEMLLDDDTAFRARLKIKEARADLYHRWGQFDKSSGHYKEYIAQHDSLQRVGMAEKLHSLRTRYEVDKLETQREQERRAFRVTLRWLGVIMILLVLITTLVVLNYRRLKSKNRSLLNRIHEHDKLEQENEHLRNELVRSGAPAPNSGGENGELNRLYFQLREMMKDPAVFTDPEINRRSIAERLDTNEKYVFDTVHKYYDMSVQDYITNLRLSYARNLLALPSEKRTVEAVALDAGFSSRSTFHRLFKERYGMTPDEFRRLVAGS